MERLCVQSYRQATSNVRMLRIDDALRKMTINRPVSDVEMECEGIELIDDIADLPATSSQPVVDLHNAKNHCRKAWMYFIASHIRATVSYVQSARLNLAYRLSAYVHGVPVWPLIVVYIIFVAGAFVVSSMIPIEFSELFGTSRTVLMFSGVLFPVFILGGFLVLMRDARKPLDSLTSQIVNSKTQYERNRIDCARSLKQLKEARAVLEVARFQEKLSRANQVESQGRFRTTVSELSHFTSSLRRRNLTGEEWEGYLEQIFLRHGYRVERTKVTGDQGVDLIVTHGAIRLAIQAKGYAGSVGNKAVQEAVAGRIYYECTHTAVITNSTFTKAARELAAKTDCILVDGSGIEYLLTNGLKNMVF